MSSKVTIDRLPDYAHQAYALNEYWKDPLFDEQPPIQDVIVAAVKPVLSYLQLLFGPYVAIQTIAQFAIPSLYNNQKNHFFGSALMPWFPIDPTQFLEDSKKSLEFAKSSKEESQASAILRMLDQLDHIQGDINSVRASLSTHKA